MPDMHLDLQRYVTFFFLCLIFIHGLSQSPGLPKEQYPLLETQDWIPSFSKPISGLYLNPELSPWVESLSEKWDFALLPSSQNYLPYSALSRLTWTSVHVPGNILEHYQSRVSPSESEEDSLQKVKLGIYTCDFVLPPSWKKGLVYLRLHGGGPKMRIFLNEHMVSNLRLGDLGTAISLNPHLKPGKNTLFIQVLLESDTLTQGMGLDRSIFLVHKPENHLEGCRAGLDAEENFELRGRLIEGQKAKKQLLVLSYTLSTPDGNPILEGEERIKSEKKSFPFRFIQQLPYILYWSAENPYLYQLDVRLIDGKGRVIEEIRQKIALCRKGEKSNKVLLNGKFIPLRGVCYRFFHPQKGHALTVADIRRDLEIMKANHINTVYIDQAGPPEFYTLCEELGMYIISKLGDDKYLDLEYAERRLKMEARYASVLLHVYPDRYSLASDAPDIPFWSETQFRANSLFKGPEFSRGDARRRLEKLPELPFLTVLGAWADKKSFFEKSPRNSQFLKDGFVTGDRKAQPELSYLKDLYSPLQLICKKDHLLLKHSYAFRNLSKVRLIWELINEDSTQILQSPLPPYFRDFHYKVPYPFGSIPRETCLRVKAYPEEEHEFLDKDFLISEASYCTYSASPLLSPPRKTKLEIQESATNLDVRFQGVSLNFDKGIRMLENVKIGDKEILNFPLYLPTRYKGKVLEESSKGIALAESIIFEKIEVEKAEDSFVKIAYQGWVSPEKEGKMRFTFTFEIYDTGEIGIQAILRPQEKNRDLLFNILMNIDAGDGWVGWKEEREIPQTRRISELMTDFTPSSPPYVRDNLDWLTFFPQDKKWQFLIRREGYLSFSLGHPEVKDRSDSLGARLYLGPMKYHESDQSYRMGIRMQLR